MKIFSVLFSCLGLMLAANMTFAQTRSSQQTEQNPPAQLEQGNRPRANREGKNRREKFRQRLAQMDRDQDQKISRDEWQRRPRAFDRFDTNHDGFITREELTARREQRRKRHEANENKPPAN